MTSIPDLNRLHDLLGACFDRLGHSDFHEPYLDIVERIVQADQCMVFAYAGDRVATTRVECVLSRVFSSDTRAILLAQTYLEDGHKADPLTARLLSLAPGSCEVIHLHDVRERMTPEYRRRYFEGLGLSDKVAVLLVDAGCRWSVNFYRAKGRPDFDNAADGASAAVWKMLARLLRAHTAGNRNAATDGPLEFLSEREREVCKGILQGDKTEIIAAVCNISPHSAITYRKRAYVKLGINSRAALFALCRRI